MKDLTQGPIAQHLLQMSLFIGATMLVQTLYYLVDLYFVAGLGEQALAGVSAAGSVMFIVLALTQIVGISAVSLIAQSVGRRDRDGANLVFNQALSLALLCFLVTLIAGYALAAGFMRLVSADAGTAAAGTIYLYWYLPGLALQFATVTMGAALRGTGIVRPTTIVQILTLALNIALAPVLIAGWGTGRALGVAGAGLATTIAIAIGTILMTLYFLRLERYVRFDLALWRPHRATWRRMLDIGLPAGGEFALIFVIHGTTYWCIQSFGASAQAGYGIGGRVMQSIFLPAMAIAFAAAPIAGQNFGAKHAGRVRATFRTAALYGSIVMAVLTLLCHWSPEVLVRGFASDPQVVRVGADYLRIMSWNFVGIGLIFTCSGLFQAVGNTWPALASGIARVLVLVLPMIWLSTQPGVRLEQFWYLSVATIALQTLFSLWLLHREFARRLVFS